MDGRGGEALIGACSKISIGQCRQLRRRSVWSWKIVVGGLDVNEQDPAECLKGQFRSRTDNRFIDLCGVILQVADDLIEMRQRGPLDQRI